MDNNITYLKPVKRPHEVLMKQARDIVKSGGRSEVRYRSFVRQLADMDITADEYEKSIITLAKLFRV